MTAVISSEVNMRCARCVMLMLTGLVVSPVVAQQRPLELKASVRNRALSVLRQGLRSDDFWPAIHAAEGLTLAGHGHEVRDHLGPLLAVESDDQRRCGLARELVRAGDVHQRSVMLGILAGADQHGHVHAAESLFKVASIGDGAVMRDRFRQSDNLRLRLMAAAALARCGSPQALEFIREHLQSGDDANVRIAAWILGRVGAAEDIPRLRTALRRTSDSAVQVNLQHALAALGDPTGQGDLVKNLSADDPATRTYAATFAGDARIYACVDRLTEMLNDPHPDARIRAAQTLLFLASTNSVVAANEDISVLTYPATKSNPRYTEGSVLELADGSLLYATTEFIGAGSDFSSGHIVGRTSADGGRTWSEQRVLQENTGSQNVMSVTLRRLRAGIAMFYLQKNSHSDLHMFVRFSSDEARTFGPTIPVTSGPGYHIVNNDRIVRLSTGRLLAPTSWTRDIRKVNHLTAHCCLSDDGGKTWRKGSGSVDLPKRGAMEPEAIELSDGRLLMILRSQLGYIARTFSEDGGETWSKPESLGLEAPEAPATLRRIPATGDLILIWNHTWKEGTDHGGKRTPLTAAISVDEGRSWKNIRNLESDPAKTFAYTSLVFVRDRAVMTYWETSPRRPGLSSRFRSLPVRWFYEER